MDMKVAQLTARLAQLTQSRLNIGVAQTVHGAALPPCTARTSRACYWGSVIP